ncbi:CHAT domain-containing protein [Anabaena sp. WFMT]|uniref:CHAT domain-containing protein n=1 Tax=Anabaena sp. WFMT TaxID=3449730 RepID=UPI003F1F5FCE
MKRQFSKLHRRLIYTVLLAVFGLILAFGIQALSEKQAISTEPKVTQLSCLTTPTLSPEQLSVQGRYSYERGDFDIAIDCWKKAAESYQKSGNETEKINNQINQAQAEQALGLYPRACNTLLQIYREQEPEKDCNDWLKDENTQDGNIQDGKKPIQSFVTLLEQRADSPAKIAGLRSLGNVLRGLGELDLSHQVLLLSLRKSQPQEKAAIWLDIGNSRRAFSNKEEDIYSRSQYSPNLVCGIVSAFAAKKAYGEAGLTAKSPSTTQLQAELNQLSLLLDIRDGYNERVIDQLLQRNRPLIKLYSQVEKCITKLTLSETSSQDLGSNEIFNNIVSRKFLSDQNQLLQPDYINNLQQQIEKLPITHTTLYTRLNFANSLIRLNQNNNQPDLENKIAGFLQEKFKQAKAQGDKKAESYALGYFGKLYMEKDPKQAIFHTQKALIIAQSIPDPNIVYQWQWQLGQIYKPKRNIQDIQAQAKDIKNGFKNLEEARKAYREAFETLQSLRRELAVGSPDAQFSFLEEIEKIYREYIDVLLWDGEPQTQPQQEHISQAREVISSLQAVELENFLRQACPENNLDNIDKIIDNKAKRTTAFISPIVLENRIETILKLPGDPILKRFNKPIVSKEKFDEFIRDVQRNLEEEYTFQDVRQKSHELYQLLVEDVDKYIDEYNQENLIKIDTLVFALDTDLRNIPLAALVRDPTSKGYLIDKYAIALAPRLEIPTPQVLQNRKINVLAAGLTEAKLPELERKFPKLNFVKEELKVLEEIAKDNPARLSVTSLSDDKFNKQEFQKKINASAFQIVHLATHGQFSSTSENTFILAADQLIRVNEVGNLFRIQAQNQKEPIELLILSACETASGDKRATLGLSGVAVRSGSRSAIASLWTIDDKFSVEFTKQFYNQLKNPNQTKAQALQQAQIALKKSLKENEHPRDWAPYILVGNWL